MARITKRTLKGRAYYYLEHTIRHDGKRTTKSKYLGDKVPRGIDKIKAQFLFELDKEKWFGNFEQIRRNYRDELKKTPKSAREKQLRDFSIRFTYNTQRIEGSTLTLRETADLLEHGISPTGKPIEDAKEAEAHDKLFREMLQFKRDMSQEVVQDWNWRLLKDTKPDVAGKIRRHAVRITGSEFTPPSPVELQPLLHEFFDWYKKKRKRIDPVELAGLVHLKFVTIHPFSDGNGRISRLMMNHVLHRNGFPTFNIEYKRRRTYYSTLERSQTGKDERPFMNWFFRRYYNECKGFLDASLR